MSKPLPVWVEAVNGHFEASILTRREVCGVGDTEALAVAALRAELARREAVGRLVWIDVSEGEASAVNPPQARPANPFVAPPWTPPEYTEERRRQAEEDIAEFYREREAEKAVRIAEIEAEIQAETEADARA